MNNHKVEIVPVVLENHPNADALSIIRVFGYTCVGRTEDWEGVDTAAYLPPDSIVDVNREEFQWLDKGDGEPVRIRARKFRGVQSYGLLIPCPEGFNFGDDAAEFLGVKHYEPTEQLDGGGDDISGPFEFISKYDIDRLQRYPHVFTDGEEVHVTEKVHGSNARYVFHDGEMWCGSKNSWKKESSKNGWWKALRNTPELEEFCRKNPDIIVYGEIYGSVQDLKYGLSPGQVCFVAFDIMVKGEWLDWKLARAISEGSPWNLPWVPSLGIHRYNLDGLVALSDGPSLIPGADHYREGIVVSPMNERDNIEVGRVKLKIVSPTYLEKSK